MAESRLMGQKFHVKMQFISGVCKNHDTCALAGSPIDFVWVAGFVMVQEFNKR
jgi:hypothetical protein